MWTGLGAAVAGSLVGGLLGRKGSKQSGNVTQTTTQVPWSGVQPYLTDIMGQGQGLYGRGAYQGDYLASLSPETQQAWQLQANRAVSGSPVTDAAQQGLLPTLQGQYLDPATNPEWGRLAGRMGEQYRENVIAPLDARFAASGNAFGDNSAYQQLYGQAARGYGEGLAALEGNLWGQERQRQLGATALAPMLANQDYFDISQLGNVGAQREARGQAEIGAAQQEFNAPWDVLGRYQQAISGGLGAGSTTSQSTPYYTNPLANILGGGMAGLQLYNGLNQSGLLGGTPPASSPYVNLPQTGGPNYGYGGFDPWNYMGPYGGT